MLHLNRQFFDTFSLDIGVRYKLIGIVIDNFLPFFVVNLPCEEELKKWLTLIKHTNLFELNKTQCEDGIEFILASSWILTWAFHYPGEWFYADVVEALNIDFVEYFGGMRYNTFV